MTNSVTSSHVLSLKLYRPVMEFFVIVNLAIFAQVHYTFCAESNGQKAHFQVEDKSGDLKIEATKDRATVTAQANSVQVVVKPGTAEYPLLKSDKPIFHICGPGGWTSCSVRKKSAITPTYRHGAIPKGKEGQEALPTSRDNADNSLGSPHEFSPAKLSSREMRLNFKAADFRVQRNDDIRHKPARKLAQRSHNWKLLSGSLKTKSPPQREFKLKGHLRLPGNFNGKDKTPLKSKHSRPAPKFTTKKQFRQVEQSVSLKGKVHDLPGSKKSEVKEAGASLHVTGNAGKIKMHVTKEATELTSESGAVDVLVKPPASGSSAKADASAQAQSKHAVHLAPELEGSLEDLGIKKSKLTQNNEGLRIGEGR